MLQEMCRVE